jgi:CHASE3 domain sensor protein
MNGRRFRNAVSHIFAEIAVEFVAGILLLLVVVIVFFLRWKEQNFTSSGTESADGRREP